MSNSRFAFAFVALSFAACSSSSPEERTEASGAEINACVAQTVQGVDVSHYQGNIDFQAVRNSGRGFVISQVGDGHYEDPTFDHNYAETKRVGMIRGAYQFFRPLNDADAVAQADILLRHVGHLGAGDLPPTLDVEVAMYGGNFASPPGVIISGIRAWTNRVREVTGVTPMIYTGAWFWPQVGNTTAFGGSPLWVAGYTSCASVPMPNGWSDWTFWQYNSTGHAVPGIAGDVDVDVFHGTIEQLTALAQGGAGCTAQETHDANHFGCSCVDHRANGGFCPGTGCSSEETSNAAKFGCGCVDHQANGVFCPGTGCTARETEDAAKFGCGCVDHHANGGFCPGTGCTPRETEDAAKFGCGCVDHKANGGACPGTGCTVKEARDCSAAHHACSLHKCVP